MIDEKKLIKALRNKQINIPERYKPRMDMTNEYEIIAFLDGLNWRQIAVMECINEQPKVNEWIPVSERLPNEEAESHIRDVFDGKGSLYPCLITYRSPNHERIRVGEFYYDIDKRCFINHAGTPCEKARCLAWQPPPEPWEGV